MLEINKIYNQDCLEGMQYIDDNTIDMILCDLPYGTTQAKWDSIIPFDKLWNQYLRIIKNNGAIVLFATQPFTSSLIMSNIKMFKYTWVWDKNKPTNFLNAKKQPLRSTEDICVFYNKQPTYNPQLRNKEKKNIRNTKYENVSYSGLYGKTIENWGYNQNREIPTDKSYPINLIRFINLGNNGGKRLHPTQKPLDLIEYLINTYSNENDLILDNCCGSGSTLVGAKNLNRKYIGFELDEKYYNIANQRLNDTELIKKEELPVVDFLKCHYCNNTFTHDNYIVCNCDNIWCSDLCASKDGYEQDENLKVTCKDCKTKIK